MKTKENQKSKEKNNKKVKRRISVITVFLWVFLVAVFSTIVLININKTNSLEQNSDRSRYECESIIESITSDVGSITKRVGESGEYMSIKCLRAKCIYCKNIVIEYIPDVYEGVDLQVSNSEVISKINYETGNWDKDDYLKGCPCLKVVFGTIRPGKTSINVSYYVNFGRRKESGNCGYCNRYITIPADQGWHNYEDTIDIIVTADYSLKYDANCTNVENMPSDETVENFSEEKCTFNVNTQKPIRNGYEFLGWAEDPSTNIVVYNGGEDITLEWISEDIVNKTLYAVWKPIAPTREELPSIIGENFVKVHCVSNPYHHDKDKYYSIVDKTVMNGEYEATIGKVYYFKEKNTYLCNIDLNGNIYSEEYSSEIGDYHDLDISENLYKELTLYYNEEENKWKVLDETQLPITFNVRCNYVDVVGFYKVIHEYYLKDENNNMILDGSLSSGTVRILYAYGERIEVGLSNEFNKVDIEVEKISNYEMNNINYKYEYFEYSGNVVLKENTIKEITLKYVRDISNETKIKVEKIWEDNDNKYLKRPENVVLQIKDGEEVVSEVSVSEENNWSYEFVVPKYDKYGNEIKYTVDEKETDKNYEKRIDGYKVINRYIGEEEKAENNNEIVKEEENVDTSDINVIMYVGIFIVSILVILAIILVIRRKNNK